MEYISLSNQQNTYPSVSNYKETGLNEISLFGNYPKNVLKFNIPKLSDLKVVKETSFKFLLQIKENRTTETSLGIFTSPIFYTELATSINESNPYFIDTAFLSEFLVTFYLDETAAIFSKLKEEEKSKNIEMTKNIFISSNDSIDLEALVKYIDWVVSPVTLSDLETNNVLSHTNLSSYKLPEIKIEEQITSAQAIEVGEKTVQVYEYKLKRIRDLVSEEIWVFKVIPLQNYTGQRRQFKEDRFYKIKEGETFIGQKLSDGSYRVYDNQRTGAIGWIQKPNRRTNPIEQVGGPFYVKIKVVDNKSNTTSSGGGTTSFNSSGGGGGSSGYVNYNETNPSELDIIYNK